MKRVYIILTILMLAGCTQNPYLFPSDDCVEIIGQEISCFGTPSRNNSVSLIKEGAQISLYAKGGITSYGDILELQGNRWGNTQHLHWNDTQTSAQVIAYCPPLTNHTQELYHNGELQDIIMAQENCAPLSPICLHFTHLFSQICFEVEESLNNQLTSVTLVPHVIINKIDAETGTLETKVYDSQKIHTYNLHLKATSSRCYYMLIPPHEKETVDIILHTKDGQSFFKSLTPFNCKQGQCYKCKIKAKEQQPGIYTAEDFIAFSYLINHKAYKDRSLKEFGDERNGRKTFYLRNNIQFSDAEKKQILKIADEVYSSNREAAFEDVFNGMGHTLSNVLIQAGRGYCCGLFQNIGTKGIVKNLTVSNVENTCNSQVIIGLFAGLNQGLIDNCHLRNSTARQNEKGEIAALVAYNKGIIANCSIENINLHIPQDQVIACLYSGITSQNDKNGQVINCYTHNLTTTNARELTTKISCVTLFNKGLISNCIANQHDAIFYPITSHNYSIIECCYYPEADKNKMNKINLDKGKVSFSYPYSPNRESKQHIVNRLNNWITNKSKEYPQITFNTWKLAGNLLITFD